MAYDIDIEKREAIEAGRQALLSLRAAKKDLDSARGWGIVDILGGGLITDIIKHVKLDGAKKNVNQARRDLQRFSKELRDVSDLTGTDFGIGDFAVFADFFFDGMLADFYMQSKINNARNQVDDAIFKIENIICRLQ